MRMCIFCVASEKTEWEKFTCWVLTNVDEAMNLLLSIAYTSITIAQFSHGFYAVFTLFCFSLSLSLVRILFLHRKIQLLILLQFYFLFSSYFFCPVLCTVFILCRIFAFSRLFFSLLVSVVEHWHIYSFLLYIYFKRILCKEAIKMNFSFSFLVGRNLEQTENVLKLCAYLELINF